MYAGLATYLPDDASNNAFRCDVAIDTTPNEVIDRYGVPRDQAHLVLKNGHFIEPHERDEPSFKDGDVFALWPPVAGG